MTKTILEEALAIVDGARQADYGTPLDNHTRTANLWNAYLALVPGEEAKPLTPKDVCMLNILQKISRLRHSHTRDGLVDIAGYAENAQRCEPVESPLVTALRETGHVECRPAPVIWFRDRPQTSFAPPVQGEMTASEVKANRTMDLARRAEELAAAREKAWEAQRKAQQEFMAYMLPKPSPVQASNGAMEGDGS